MSAAMDVNDAGTKKENDDSYNPILWTTHDIIPSRRYLVHVCKDHGGGLRTEARRPSF